MLINDLKHLETVNETPEVVGGSGYFFFNGAQTNIANVWQSSNSKSDAESFDGDATATALSANTSVLGQSNSLVYI